jgi:hypothetical protein
VVAQAHPAAGGLAARVPFDAPPFAAEGSFSFAKHIPIPGGQIEYDHQKIGPAAPGRGAADRGFL